MNAKIQMLYLSLVIVCNYSTNCDSDVLSLKTQANDSNKYEFTQLEKKKTIKSEKDIDVNGTIEEVERILSLNPNLPRLSRSEILHILDNITKTDNLEDNPLAQNDVDKKTREEHQRAIMYVMPFSPKNYSYENIQELFTKPPVVKIVDNNSEEIDYYNIISPTKRPSIVLRKSTTDRVQNSTINNNKKTPEKTTTKAPLQLTGSVENKFVRPARPQRPQTNVMNDKKTNIKKINEVKSIENANYPPGFLEKLRNKTLISSTTARPNRGTVRYPNHKYPEESTLKKTQQSNEAIKLVTAPTISLEQKLTKPFDTDHWNVKPKIDPNNVYDMPETNRPFMRPSPFKLKQSSVYRTSTVQPQHVKTSVGNFIKAVSFTTQSSIDEIDLDLLDDVKDNSNIANKPPVSLSFNNNKEINNHKMTVINKEELDIDIPEHLKDLIKNVDLNSAETQSTNTKYSSHYTNPEALYPNKLPYTIPDKNNVKEFQDSIGLFQDPVTTTIKPDWSDAVEGLDPEMKQLLMTFGLIPNPDEDQKPASSEVKYDYAEPNKPVIQANSYASFKPLPDTAPSREDMHSFLSTFGLMSDSRRSQKSMNISASTETPKIKHLDKVPFIETQMLPDNMRGVLEDIGLIQPLNTRTSKVIRSGSNVFKTQEKSHVFNPESAFATTEELKKLEQLISTIKQLDKLNGSVTQSDLDSLDLANIKELTESLNKASQKKSFLNDKETDNLSPLSLTELNNIFKIKTDFKRQNSNSSVSSNSSESSTTDAIISTTEQSKSPSVADLADSFGVNTDVSDQTVPDEALPEQRKSGLYFLVDWNSFLEVGEDDKNKVNIRIAPRVGDPSRFINVKVP